MGTGLVFLALSYWVIRHTYVGYEWEGMEKVWTKRMTLPRWMYLAAWILYPLMGVSAVVPFVFLVVFIAVDCCFGSRAFIWDSRIGRWLTEKI